MTTTTGVPEPVRVGIIGAGGWAEHGHIPALRSLPGFRITAISSRSADRARELATAFDIPHTFTDPGLLIEHPDVDLVVVTTSPLGRPSLVKKAIAAGKDVHAEWPLTTTTAGSEELLALAEDRNVRHVVALQRRFSPAARYMHDLIQRGDIGAVRTARLTIRTPVFGPVRPQAHAWTTDPSNNMNIVTTWGGQQMDLLFHLVGRPRAFTGLQEPQFSTITIEETGETITNQAPDAAVAIGALEGGGLVTVQLVSGTDHDSDIEIHVIGTTGTVKLSAPVGNAGDFLLEGALGKTPALTELPVPTEYQQQPSPGLPASVEDLATLYAHYSSDQIDSTANATSFRDAVVLHRLIDQIRPA
jgi:predicted dehydrogenase